MQPTHILWRFLFHAVSILGTIAIIIFLCVQMQSSYDLSFPWFFIFLAAYLGIIWLTIIVHELGHALAAWLVGFRIDVIVVGLVKLMRMNGRFKWSVNVDSFAPGYIVATPLSSHRLHARYTLFILGGPISSLLIAIASALLCMSYIDQLDASNAINGIRHKSGAPVYLFFASGLSALVNLNAFLLSSIPMLLPGGHPNDAAILLWFRRQKHACQLRDLQLGSLGYMMTQGIRPNQWNRDELLQCLGTMRSGTASDLQAYLMGYYHFLDAGAISIAESLLEKALECHHEHANEARPSVLLESVYFKAMFQNDAANAWEIIKQCGDSTGVEKPTRLRAEAAAHLAEGNVEHSQNKANEALRLLKYAKDKGGALAEADWLNAIINKCPSARNTITSPPAAGNSDIQSSPESR